ncbi:DUF3558 domain-containing protein [Amycolatopsis sp. cg5]|uniref:DUF3558 domain-containing protein n=1 Tax=Amycolatopsis sp. cg5 TaxID=3238802 RepID=UPI003523A97D
MPLLVLGLLVACGCSNGNLTQSTPSVDSSSTQAGSTSLPHSGAPKVVNPLPASVVSGDPCTDTLNPEQLKRAIGATVQGKPDTLATGPTCDWGNLETGGHVGVGYTTRTRQGLSGLYQNTKPQAIIWRELPLIQGFPAVAHVTPQGGLPDVFCAVDIGIADDLSVDVGIFLGGSKKGKVDPCGVAAQVADLVMTTLRQRAGG